MINICDCESRECIICLDNLINDKPIQFNCIYSLKFKKWIPILPIEK